MGDGYEEYPIADIVEDFNYPVELVKETLDVFIKMYDNGYYRIGLTGSEEEVSRKAFEKWD